ncbi:MAG: right-handed parallel beta-helix repeat-containing protein, partial [Synergistaceae bacterium]|nr:right-handed parallel beta-helix repeat-containing protein [Synergistaceae bacterium]
MSCLVAVFLLLPPESSEALSGGGTRTNPYLVGNGADLDEALVIIADDYKPVDPNAENQNVSDMHYISLTADVDAITSATYGNEDEDHPVRVTIEGNGHIISGDIPDEPPAHAAGNKYTGLRFANRTPFTEAGRGNHIVLKNLTVRGLYNAETHGGGALAIFGGKLEVENCVFDGNASYGTSRGGGAILLQHRASLLSIKNSTFVNNTSRGSGGAVDSSGDQDNAETAGENVVIENSTFYGNKSTEAVIETTGRDGSITRSPQGGGAITYSRALGRITNSTIVGNEAASGKGGGVYARWDISGNASGLGTRSDVKLENSIVAGNGSGADVDLSDNNPASADVTGSYNVIGTSGAPSGAFSNTQSGADVSDFLAPGAPKVHAEGATPTIALLGAPGSPALNKVPLENAPALDQRGRPRVGLADIGAFELQVPGNGTASSPFSVKNGLELDEALIVIADDYRENSEGQNISDMHYVSLTADVDAITSATYGDEDGDHPVRVTIDGNGYAIRGVLPASAPTHARGKRYTGLRFANRTPFTADGRGNHIILKNLTARGLYNAETHGGGALAIFGGKLEV